MPAWTHQLASVWASECCCWVPLAPLAVTQHLAARWLHASQTVRCHALFLAPELLAGQVLLTSFVAFRLCLYFFCASPADAPLYTFSFPALFHWGLAGPCMTFELQYVCLSSVTHFGWPEAARQECA